MNLPEWSAVLEGGCSTLPPEMLARLAISPRYLLEWQEMIVNEGGPFWNGVVRTAEHEELHARVRDEVLAAIESSSHQRVTSVERTKGDQRLKWLTLAIAASLLVGLGIWWTLPNPAPTWGFDRPGALASDVTAKELFLKLADAAGEWGRKKPGSAEELEQRLIEFRHGCDTLLAAPLPQLETSERAWLRERCLEWRTELDEQIADLKGGAAVEGVRQQVDQLAGQMAEELKERAEG